MDGNQLPSLFVSIREFQISFQKGLFVDIHCLLKYLFHVEQILVQLYLICMSKCQSYVVNHMVIGGVKSTKNPNQALYMTSEQMR